VAETAAVLQLSDPIRIRLEFPDLSENSRIVLGYIVMVTSNCSVDDDRQDMWTGKWDG
jgi:hypothetical protein